MEKIDPTQPLNSAQQACIYQALKFYKLLGTELTSNEIDRINNYQYRRDILQYPNIAKAIATYEPLLKQNVDKFDDKQAKNDLQLLNQIKAMTPRMHRDYDRRKEELER